MQLENVLNDLINENEYCHRVIERKSVKLIVMAREDYEVFIKYKGRICEK